MTAKAILWALGILVMAIGPAGGEDFGFEIPEEPEPRLEVHGNLDGKWGLLQTRKASPFYAMRFHDAADSSDYLSQYRLDFYLNGDYRLKQVAFFARTYAQYVRDEPAELSFFELYGSLNLSPRLTVGLGKRRYNWGKGYAFNPVGYVNAEKDPENPDLALGGRASAYLTYNRSFAGAWVQNASLAGVLLPPSPDLLGRYASASRTGGAVKLYLLVRDIDLDFMALWQKGEPSNYGLDFSTNLASHLEVHGELSYVREGRKRVLQNGVASVRPVSGVSYLLGTRYLTSWNTTFLAEYYHTALGLSREEYRDGIDYLAQQIDGGDPVAIREATTTISEVIGSRTAMQDYLYLKAIQPEPFGWLYASASLFVICNLEDASFILSPVLTYKPYTNFEFLVWPTVFAGDPGTEFGSRQFSRKAEAWMRFYF